MKSTTLNSALFTDLDDSQSEAVNGGGHYKGYYEKPKAYCPPAKPYCPPVKEVCPPVVKVYHYKKKSYC
jgi:hypothetical protein